MALGWVAAAVCVAGVALGHIDQSLCVAGVALRDIDRHFAWQAWHLSHWAGSGGVLGPRLAPLAPRLFAWQAWHSATSTVTLRGRCGTYGTGLAPVLACRSWLHTYLHTYILTYIHTSMHAYIHAYIHTYIIIHTYHLFTHHLSLSHNIFHIRLCPPQLLLLLDPSPPPLSFLPSPSRYNICCSLLEEVDMWG